MVYQEQVMQMAQIVGGYSLGGADLLRRAMGKKVPAEMAKHREIFREGAGKNDITPRKADEIFDLMEKFAGYGFNKSHAAAYSLVAYQTAWLKKHYPAEFMAATLSSDMDKTDKVVGFLDEARGLGLEMLLPDVNHSDFMFVANNAGTVRYGLGAVKGVGQGVCEAIVEARAGKGDFHDLADFCKRVDSAKLNKRAVEALINAGAVSYTHLDVYKRQAMRHAAASRRRSAWRRCWRCCVAARAGVARIPASAIPRPATPRCANPSPRPSVCLLYTSRCV